MIQYPLEIVHSQALEKSYAVYVWKLHKAAYK